LHFADNETVCNFEGPEKLFKNFPVILHLNNKFQELYLPKKDISNDESLMLWKGRLSFKHTFLSKHPNLESKLTSWLFLVHTGKDTKLDSPLITAYTSKTTAIVLKLVEPLLKQGRPVWMDSFYDSPSLARMLKITHNADCVGTLKLNRKHVPPKVKNTKLKKMRNRSTAFWTGFCHKMVRRRIVTMISTYHSHETRMVTVREKEVVKLISVLDHNKSMIGVDLKDQLLHSYLIERK
jgi:hypothetical protein